MPVIIRGSFANGNGINLDDCSNISCALKTGGIEIKWTDPQDVVFNGKITAQWIGTKLVRKTGAYPTSETDGTVLIDSKVRNAYSSQPFIDKGVQNNTVYYYCLFPYTEKSVTKSDSNRFKQKMIVFNSVLKNNTWEQIAQASEAGIASTIWNIGDEINLTLSGEINQTITMQIWDFNHFDKSDGTGKAGIIFGTKNLLNSEYKMNTEATSQNGWRGSLMRSDTMIKVYNSLPPNLKKIVKEVNVRADKGKNNNFALETVKDKVFIPSYKETGVIDSSNPPKDDGSIKIPIFTDDTSRIKKINNSAKHYWLRTSYTGYSNNFHNISDRGSTYSDYAFNPKGVCFCFNI